jgi:hypothetical protein
MFSQSSSDAFDAFETPSASFTPATGVGALDLDPISRDLLRRASAPAPLPGGVPQTEPQWNFVSMDAEHAHDTGHEEPADPELERYLVEEIARASRRRPLMKRIERVESAYAELPGRLPVSPAPAMPPPLPSLGDAPRSPSPADFAPINQLMEDFGESFDEGSPPSAEWLQKAQRERRRARRQTLLAWLATLTIGAAIIAATLQGLQT